MYEKRPEYADVRLHAGLEVSGNRLTPFTPREPSIFTYNIMFDKNSFLLQGSKIIRLNL
jgi:hypothetical protein